MRIAAFFLHVVIAGFAAGCGKPASTTQPEPTPKPTPNPEGTTRADKERLQGVWVQASVEWGDKAIDVPASPNVRFVFQADTLRMWRITPEGRAPLATYAVTIDANHEPRKITWIRLAGWKEPRTKQVPSEIVGGLYRFDGEDFVLCSWGVQEERWPPDFIPRPAKGQEGSEGYVPRTDLSRFKKLNEPPPSEQ